LDVLAEITADPSGSIYVGDGEPLSTEETQQWIENSLANIRQYDYGTGAVEHVQHDQLIGWAGIARPGDGSEEVIYGLHKQYWGQGYGTELLVGLISWSTQQLGLAELRATVHPKNLASIRLLLNQGFVLVDACYEDDANCSLYVLRGS